MFTEQQGHLLTSLARAAIAREFDEETDPLPHPAWLDAPGAVFVTLTEGGRLRGCIGSLEAHRSLGEDLDHNARAAAFSDPRFPRLAHAELGKTRVEVSVISPASPMTFSDEADALRQLRLGIDGVILEFGWHRATFLPQVWEQLPEPRVFLAHLKQKAGLAGDFWDDDLRLSRYGVEKFEEAA
jgi:hypothetical protein